MARKKKHPRLLLRRLLLPLLPIPLPALLTPPRALPIRLPPLLATPPALPAPPWTALLRLLAMLLRLLAPLWVPPPTPLVLLLLPPWVLPPAPPPTLLPPLPALPATDRP